MATATFLVTYSGAFDLQKETAFQAALDVWARVLTAPRAITISLDFMFLGPYILGGTSVPNQYHDLPGMKPGALYPVAGPSNSPSPPRSAPPSSTSTSSSPTSSTSPAAA